MYLCRVEDTCFNPTTCPKSSQMPVPPHLTQKLLPLFFFFFFLFSFFFFPSSFLPSPLLSCFSSLPPLSLPSPLTPARGWCSGVCVMRSTLSGGEPLFVFLSLSLSLSLSSSLSLWDAPERFFSLPDFVDTFFFSWAPLGNKR